MALKLLPQGERYLQGTLAAQLAADATTMTVDNPPDANKLPTYIELEPDSDQAETVKAIAVAGNVVTIVRGVYSGGVGVLHLVNTSYKQKFSQKHWDAAVDAVESGFLLLDDTLTITRDSNTQFTISDQDYTAYFTAGRVIRANASASYVFFVASSSLSSGDTVVTLKAGSVLPTPLNSIGVGIQPTGFLDMTTLVTLTGSETLTNKILTSPTITTPGITRPKITTSIDDANGNEVIKTPATTNAVNELTLTNSITGSPVEVSASGDDTNINLNLKPKGTGTVNIYNNTGWIPDDSTWTYASASSFTVAGDVTSAFQPGTLLKYTQSATVKFAVVKSSSYGAPNTTVNILVNTDYVIANSAITGTYYSYTANPRGWPQNFSFTPILSANGGTPPALGNATAYGRYQVSGRTITIYIYIVFGSTSTYGSGGAVWAMGVPIAPALAGQQGTLICMDMTGAFTNIIGSWTIDPTASSCWLSTHSTTGAGYIYTTTPFTWASGDKIMLFATYQF